MSLETTTILEPSIDLVEEVMRSFINFLVNETRTITKVWSRKQRYDQGLRPFNVCCCLGQQST